MSRDTTTRKIMVKRKVKQCSPCPRCYAPDEDILHIEQNKFMDFVNLGFEYSLTVSPAFLLVIF